MKKQMWIASALLCATMLTACNKSDDKKKDGAGNRQANDITDTSICTGESPAGMNIFMTSWTYTSQLEDMTVETILKVDRNQLRLRSIFKSEDQAANVDLRVSANVSPSAIEITSEDQGSATLRTSKGDRNFRRTMGKGTFNYVFQGPCLKMTAGNETQLFVPVVGKN